ncbi:MAG TPA: carboxypeptidase-like regulatory domain-containing protein [Patescibacteria group bacterium]|nr:carboxypeptidase-like regulatory domain-containing protein [Patescibacteria group bacterium]
MAAIFLLPLALAISVQTIHAAPRTTLWQIQSVDTMKYSRDLAREKLNDNKFDAVIDQQIKNIAATGATYVAIATPYDEEFYPFLSRWVSTARKYNLGVWFRGNWSGWERWFNYPSISREDLLIQTEKFITSHPKMFADGDVFSPCPECENGGIGDPRHTGDVSGYRGFLLQQYSKASTAFTKINKQVLVLNSHNLDVAKLIMDSSTSAGLGGIIAVDHYVSSPQKLVNDLSDLSSKTGAQIILGEFGVPIKDLHGNMTEIQQSGWLDSALRGLSLTKSVIGVNYWTSVGGSTQLWSTSGKSRSAVGMLTSYYIPKTISGIIVNALDEPVAKAQIFSTVRTVQTDSQGRFQLAYLEENNPLLISAPGYYSTEYHNYSENQIHRIIVKKVHEGILFRLKYLLLQLKKSILH